MLGGLSYLFIHMSFKLIYFNSMVNAVVVYRDKSFDLCKK